MKSSLFFRIYFSFIIVGLFALLGAGGAAVYLLSKASVGRNMKGTVSWILARLPDAQKNPNFFRKAFQNLADQSQTRMGLWNKKGKVIASSEKWNLRPQQECQSSIWIQPSKQEIGLCFALQDGRWFAIAAKKEQFHELRNQIALLFFLLFALIWVGCYPLARSISRRLERLQKGVQDLGKGEFNRRVPIEGTDEIAQLAKSFNLAAAQIQDLMQSQRRFLASASHDLRTPLGRIRMAMELMQEELPPASKEKIFKQAKSDIALLNGLIEDILLASQLQQHQILEKEKIDLCSLAQKEALRFSAKTDLHSCFVEGDKRLLQRLLQNLLDNARRYGEEKEILVQLNNNQLIIADRGPGIPPAQQERVFEPFYRPRAQREKNDGGVGLGLSVVRDIAKAHGARVYYQDRKGGGAKFIVDFSGN